MNILIYFSNPLDPQRGGTERVAYLIANYLSNNGHDVFQLACVNDGGNDSEKMVYLPDAEERATEANIKFLQEYIRNNRIQVIINESGNSDAIFLFSHEYIPFNVKIITHLHFDIYGDIKTFYQSQYLPLLNVPIEKALKNMLRWLKMPYNKFRAEAWKKERYVYLYDNSDLVVLLTNGHMIDFMRLTGCDGAKLTAVTNPISYIVSDKVLCKKKDVILYVGRLDYPKRVDRILRVWSKLQKQYTDWQMCILGDGPDSTRLKLLSDKLGLKNIEFVGRANPTIYYNEAKLLLMTSNYEGTPMVIYEAMSHGVVPIVMDTFPGVKDMIENNVDGLVTRRFNIDSMKDSCAFLMSNLSEFHRMSQNAMLKMKYINNNELLSVWTAILH